MSIVIFTVNFNALGAKIQKNKGKLTTIEILVIMY